MSEWVCAVVGEVVAVLHWSYIGNLPWTKPYAGLWGDLKGGLGSEETWIQWGRKAHISVTRMWPFPQRSTDEKLRDFKGKLIYDCLQGLGKAPWRGFVEFDYEVFYARVSMFQTVFSMITFQLIKIILSVWNLLNPDDTFTYKYIHIHSHIHAHVCTLQGKNKGSLWSDIVHFIITGSTSQG